VNVIFVGPVDLAVSIDGVPKIIKRLSLRNLRILEEIVKVSIEAEVITGCPCDIDQFENG